MVYLVTHGRLWTRVENPIATIDSTDAVPRAAVHPIRIFEAISAA